MGNALSTRGSCDLFFLSDCEKGYADEEALNPNPKILPFFEGTGGGGESGSSRGGREEYEVGELSSRRGGSGFPSARLFSWYFLRINLSMAESASSASRGMSGFLFLGLYALFTAMLPLRFMLY